MTTTISLTGAMQLPPEVQAATRKLEQQLIAAVREVRSAGLPQGLIVALLHARAHIETGVMIDE